MALKPLADRIIVQALEAEEMTAGGIILPGVHYTRLGDSVIVLGARSHRVKIRFLEIDTHRSEDREDHRQDRFARYQSRRQRYSVVLFRLR